MSPMKLMKPFLYLLVLGFALCFPEISHVVACSTQPAEGQQIDAQLPQIDIQIVGMTGMAGWYRSITIVSVTATSGLTNLEMRVDGGDWQSGHSLKLTEDGVHLVEVRATHADSNQPTISKEVKLDQHDPTGQFTAPQGGMVVQGIVQVQGTVHDELSGMGQVSISIDDGKTWQAVPLQADGSWSTTWDTRSEPDGMHAVQAKFSDQAGNTSSAEIFYIVANHPAQIHLTPRWEVGDKGKLDILPGDIRLMDVTIDISDPKGRWPDIHLDYSPNQAPKEIVWDGKFGEISAPSGEYNVTVRVTDLTVQQIEAHGVIVIPPVSTPEVLQTLPPTAVLQASGAAAQGLTATRRSGPTGTMTALPTMVAAIKTPAPPLATSSWSFLRWLILLAGAGTLLAFCWRATRNPRSQDMKKQNQAISEVHPADEP